MSHRKQPTNSRVPSLKEKNRVVYFKKEYKLMIHNISLEEEIRSTVFSLHAANYTSIPHAAFMITLNETVDITTIDMTSNQEEKADLQVTLDLSHFAKGIKNDLAIVKFQVAKEKILAPSSVNFYTQPLANRKGTIQYKFVGLKVTQIEEEEFVKYTVRRDEIAQIQKQLAQNPQLKRLIQILDAKDQVIHTLERKIASLIQQTRKLTHSLQRQKSEQKSKLKQGLNLNLNINASNNYHMKRLNDKLIEQNEYLHKRMQTLQHQLQEAEKRVIEEKCENNILRIQLGKKSVAELSQINVNYQKTVIQHNKQLALQKIAEQEHDQQLERRSKLADSFFMHGDDASVRSKIPTNRRPNHALTMNGSNVPSGLTPRNISKSRTKSVADLAASNNPPQQGQQSKVMDQEQVQIELNELKDLRDNLENKLMDAVPQQDGTMKYPRLEATIKSSYRMIQRLNQEKNLTQQKVKRREQEIEYLRRQLQKSKANFRNFQKQLRERSSNAKDQFEQRMAAIKMETELKMAEMRKQNRFGDYESVMQQEKRQIELEKMRYENDALREKYEQAMSELRNLQLQKASEVNKYRNTQIAINKEKDMYKSKYYEMQDSFSKQEEQLTVTKEKAKLYQIHMLRIQELQKIEQSLKQKIQKQEKANQQLKNKLKRYQDKFAQIQPKWQGYRNMQQEFELIKRKNINLTKLNERFQSRMEEMKKFTLRLQNAYYEKKQKNQSDFEFDEHYKKQMEERLQQTLKKLRAFQKEFYQEQQKELNQSKKEMIEFYYKRIVEQHQRIDQNPSYTEIEKQKLKNQKEHEINVIKEGKLDQVDRQIKKYQMAFSKLVSTEEYMPKGLNEKITFLEEKMRKFQSGEFGMGMMSNSSQSMLKNTVDKLNESLRAKESQITQLKKTMGKMSDGSNLLKVNNIQATFANQRKSMIEEMAKSREIFSKSFDDLKKANAQLLKQKSALQIELQNYKFKEEKLILRNTERERELERVAKKNTDDFKKKVADLEKALEKKSDQNLKNKLQKEEFKENMNNLIGELNSTASLLQKRQEDNMHLESQNEQLKARIQLYEQAQKSVMDEFKRVQQQAQFNQKQFKALMIQRNEQFIKIQRIKNSQIQKLRKTIAQYEFKLETEVTQVLHTRRDLQKMQEKCNELESQLEETKVSFNVVNENYLKVEEDSVLKIHQLQQANQQLEKNLMEMAQTLKETQMQLHQGKIKLDSLEKQLKAISSIKQDLTQQQLQFTQKQKHYEQIIQEQNQKLSSLQKKYVQISQKVSQVERENQSVNFKLIDKESQIQDIREKLNRKYDEVNQVKSMKFDSDMKVKQLLVDIQAYEQEKLDANERIIVLEQEIQEMRVRIQKTENQTQQQQQPDMQKSRLRPPPKTMPMTGSMVSNQQDLAASRLNKSYIKPQNQARKTTVLSKKEIKELQASQRSNLYIEEAQSIRGTQVNAPGQLLNIEENGPNRFRIWTVSEAAEQSRSPGRTTTQNQKIEASYVNVDLSEESNEDANLQSDMSAREKNLHKSQQIFNSMMRNNKDNQNESLNDENVKQVESYGSNQIIQQYLKEIQALRVQIQSLQDDKNQLQEENMSLKEKIQSLTGNVQDSNRKNLLASALGLTGGLFMKQQAQRSSVESNHENPNVPKLKMKSGANVTPPRVSSRQAIRVEDNKELFEQFGASRKSSLNSPQRVSKLSPRDRRQSSKSPTPQVNFARSSVRDVVSSRKQELEQDLVLQSERVKELELMLDEVEEENKQLRAALQDEHMANEKLMEEIQLIHEAQEQKHLIIEQKTREIDQITQYYEQLKQQLQEKIEKLVEQQIQKQSQEVKLLKTFESKNQQLQTLSKKIQTLQKQISSKTNQITQLLSEKEKSYKEYRKYEEESELQILRLREQVTALTEINSEKVSEVELIAEDYFELNNRYNSLTEEIKQSKYLIAKKDLKIEEITQKYNEAVEEVKKNQQQKRQMRQQIHSLENDLVAYENNITDVNKATSLTLKKYEIKLNTSEEEKSSIKEKLSERENIIQSLKHQIALYNDETEQLKQLNRELTGELERTQRQLKDIMKSYEQQFSNLNLDINSSNQNLQKYKQLIYEKDDQINKLTKTIKSLQCETQAALNSQSDIKQTYQKYKSAKQSQISSLLAQIEVKNDQCEKIKRSYEKDSEEFFTKEQDYIKKLGQSEESKKSYKEKLLKYQTVLEELEKEMEVMSLRPTKEQYDEQEFQNQLYKNRIQELEQLLREFAPQAQHQGKHSSNMSNQAMQHEFKKYKLQKQRQLDDLSSQIDKYCSKINQLQQGNFMLKKQVEKLRQEMTGLLEQNDGLQEENYDLKEDLAQLKEEIEFYKGKRIENLSKLLNETM